MQKFEMLKKNHAVLVFSRLKAEWVQILTYYVQPKKCIYQTIRNAITDNCSLNSCP